MIFTKVSILLSSILVGALVATFSCSNPEQEIHNPSIELDLEEIQTNGVLRAIVDNSSTSYFIYEGQVMGYEYELLSLLAKDLKLQLELIPVSDIDSAFQMLNQGYADILAYNLTITADRRKKVAFTEHHTQVKQVLVQRKPEGWQKLKIHELERRLVRNPIQLVGKAINVRKNSASHTRLLNLSEEIGGGIDIILDADSVDTDEEIKRVSTAKIDFTIADENIAKVNAAYYSNIDIKTEVSFPQRIAWAVRKNSPELLEAIDQWILRVRNTSDYHTIYNKYFKSSKSAAKRARSKFSSIGGGNISRYDRILKEAAKNLNWDWRLMAAQMFKESKFNPTIESSAGAVGLMQLVENTAKSFGARDPNDPRQNIFAASKYLQWLDNFFKKEIPDEGERLLFVLAAYNAGQGHVNDAIRLTKKYGGNPEKWQDVSKYLKLLSEQKYYSDPAAKHGFCRGSQVVRYVKDVLLTYNHYKKLIPA